MWAVKNIHPVLSNGRKTFCREQRSSWLLIIKLTWFQSNLVYSWALLIIFRYFSDFFSPDLPQSNAASTKASPALMLSPPSCIFYALTTWAIYLTTHCVLLRGLYYCVQLLFNSHIVNSLSLWLDLFPVEISWQEITVTCASCNPSKSIHASMGSMTVWDRPWNIIKDEVPQINRI